jgi:hypothetical protein
MAKLQEKCRIQEDIIKTLKLRKPEITISDKAYATPDISRSIPLKTAQKKK